MRSSAVLLLSGVSVALTTLGAPPARAYVCSRVQDSDGNAVGPSLSWFKRDLTFTLDPAGTADIPDTAALDAVLVDSFAVWQNLTDNGEGPTCSSYPDVIDVTFTEVAKQTTTAVIGYDYLNPSANENLLVFYDTGWPHSDLGSGIIALTTTTYNARTGEIIDADIEFNSEQFRFTIGDTRVSTDVMNTAVHEIGHFLGLGHSPIAEATMYAGAQLGETKKRTLACDDRDGIVFKYPAGEANGYCDPPTASCGYCAPPNAQTSDVSIGVVDSNSGTSSGGCQASPSGSLGFLLLVALGLVARRRLRSEA